MVNLPRSSLLKLGEILNVHTHPPTMPKRLSAASQILIIFKQDLSWNPKPMYDWLASLPSNEYALVCRKGSPRSRWWIALRFQEPTEIALPDEIQPDDVQWLSDERDVFHRIRDFGVPTGTHVYNLVSLLGEHLLNSLP